jgi:putative addiction module killer protein
MYELRIHTSPGYRIYYAEDKNEIVILLIGGTKSTQKQDIKKAIKYWNDYLDRRQK